MRKRFLSLGIIVAMLLMMVPHSAFGADFSIDPVLENIIIENEGLENLTIADLENMEYLYLNRWNNNDPAVQSLEGIQYAKNLKYIDIHNHPISDLSPIKDIPFKSISLSDTNVSDLSPLQNWTITDDVYFQFPNNAFTSLKGLNKIKLSSQVKGIKAIDFSGNKLTNIDEIAAFENYTFSYIEGIQLNDNKLTDISPLAKLNVTDKVYQIDLSNNNIQDITPLAKFFGKDIEYINVSNNPLNAESLQMLYHLEAKGTFVQLGTFEDPSGHNYSNIVRKWDEKESNEALVNKSEVPLNHPFKIHFSDDLDLSLLNNQNIQVRDQLFNVVDVELALFDSKTLLIKPKKNFEVLSVYSIYLSPNLTSANGTSIKESIFYSFKTVDTSPTVVFNSKVLEKDVRSYLNLSDNQRISEIVIKDLTFLSLSDNIYDLTGLERATNLISLSIHGDLSANFIPLKNLKKLEYIDISSTTSSPDYLASLNYLKNVTIRSSVISDLTFLKNPTLLTDLDLSYSSINSLVGLESLTSLKSLWIPYITGNAINDLSGILSLTDLEEIVINNEHLTPNLRQALEQNGVYIYDF